MNEIKTFNQQLFEYFGIGHYSQVVKIVFVIFIAMLVLIVVLFFITLIILVLHKIIGHFNQKRNRRITQELIHYTLDSDTPKPYARKFEKKIFRNALMDLLYITKGMERSLLKEIYVEQGYYQWDINRLKSPYWNRRLEALIRLDQWHENLGEKILLKVLRDSNYKVRENALRNLSRTQDPAEAKDLLNLLVEQKIMHSTMYETIHRLISNHTDLVLDSLYQKHFEPLWPFVLKVCGNLRILKSVPHLIVMTESNNQNCREKAIASLGKIGDPRAIDAIKKGLIDNGAEVRLSSLKALHSIDEEQIWPYKNLLLTDEDPLVRNWMHFFVKGRL